MKNVLLIKMLSVSLVLAIVITFSMVTLASPNSKLMGELTVSGKLSTNGDVPFVLVNGERVQNGRTILSSSTITTEDSSAIINFGKMGSVEIAPNSSLALNISDSDVTGNILAGKVKAFGTMNAKIRNTSQSQQSSGSGGGYWVWVAVAAGAAAVLIWVASNSNSASSLGGSSVSPTR
jgi:hypothetical protein